MGSISGSSSRADSSSSAGRGAVPVPHRGTPRIENGDRFGTQLDPKHDSTSLRIRTRQIVKK